MSSRLCSAARPFVHIPAVPVLGVSFLLLSLSGCGPARNAFPPVCPSFHMVPALADLTRYAGPGPAHDLPDLVLQARVVKLDGSCEPGDEPSELHTKVQVTLSIQRGPAMNGREADVPVFVAVTEGENVRDKKVFPVHLTFPPNVDRMTGTSAEIDMVMPISATISGASYGIIAGFQLSPDELAANRRAGGG
jgi:hypothetical protein